MDDKQHEGFHLTPFDIAIVSSLLFLVILTIIVMETYGLVDNTKKNTLVVTAIVLQCYHNNTGCEVVAVETNRTDLGNTSKPMTYDGDFFKL